MKLVIDYFTRLAFHETLCKLERVYPAPEWVGFTNDDIMNLMSVEDIKRFKEFVSNQFFFQDFLEEQSLRLTSFAKAFLECLLNTKPFELDSIKY